MRLNRPLPSETPRIDVNTVLRLINLCHHDMGYLMRNRLIDYLFNVLVQEDRIDVDIRLTMIPTSPPSSSSFGREVDLGYLSDLGHPKLRLSLIQTLQNHVLDTVLKLRSHMTFFKNLEFVHCDYILYHITKKSTPTFYKEGLDIL
jgi:hypothetical protein